MARHLVTGGSGFVGANLAKLLIAQGEQVRVLDLWREPALPASVEFVHCDINDKIGVLQAMQGIDYVHHQAALVPLAKAGNQYWHVNVNGTANALACAAQAGVRFFSHMSSSAVFGSPNQMPITNHTPRQPIEIYGRAKLAAENLVIAANVSGPLKTCCIRPRTIIGPGRLGIFEILFDWIKDNANILIIGSGNELFQFVQVDDLATVSIKACLQEKPGLYNVGTDRFGTLRQDIGAVIAHAGSRSKIKSLPVAPTIAALTLLDKLNLSPLGPWHYRTYHKPFYFDITPTQTALDWQPHAANQTMLCHAYDWFISNGHDKFNAGDSVSLHKKPVKHGILKLLKAIV